MRGGICPEYEGCTVWIILVRRGMHGKVEDFEVSQRLRFKGGLGRVLPEKQDSFASYNFPHGQHFISSMREVVQLRGSEISEAPQQSPAPAGRRFLIRTRTCVGLVHDVP